MIMLAGVALKDDGSIVPYPDHRAVPCPFTPAQALLTICDYLKKALTYQVAKYLLGR